MADPDATDPEAGQTVDLALSELQGRLAPQDDLRGQLPGLEPERRVTDWGRSERVEGLIDRTLYQFLYHYWFRVEVQGIGNIPSAGGALLIANHAGAVAPDAAMIAKAIRERQPRGRPVHVLTERPHTAVPGLGMLVSKLGGVPSHPANLHRLLFDERQLVLMFPEGSMATRKSIKERYRLRRFGLDQLVRTAMRAHVPIIPLAVLGAEEAMPVFAHVNLLGRLTRLPGFPLTPAVLLPAKFRIRFLEPVQTDLLGEAPWDDGALVQALNDDIRALIQENLLELVAGRRSVWLG